ncbi:nitroreductase family protein, partial [Veillonella atypica]|uniref:nitroreductase family protein n=2 Tax=Veillonella TaxID=29465 RepID=UPI0023B10986
DSTKKISDDDWNAILNAARLSPTSLGFEAYQLLVIQNPEIREKMKAHGWGILAGLEASHVVVFLARKKADLEFDSPYIRHIQEEVKQLPAEVDAAYREKY